MRFGFKTSPQDTTWGAMLDVWRTADDMEIFESGWTSDHFHAMHGADLSSPRLEGWMTLAALAQATRRLRLGTPGERSDRLEEACQVLTGLLSERPLPLCIGGSGAKRTLRTAARYAQHWNFDTGTPALFSRSREILRQHCAEVGRDPDDILLSAQVRFAGDPARTAADAAAFGAAGAELIIVSLPPPHAPDVLQPLADALSTLGEPAGTR